MKTKKQAPNFDGSKQSLLINKKVPSVVKKSNLYDVLGKGVMPDLNELLACEPEFKCYLRPIIQDELKAWNFLADNLSASP